VLEALSRLARDERPETRNSALKALVAVQTTQVSLLPPDLAHQALWEQLMPATRSALDAAKAADAAPPMDGVPLPGTARLIVHHSRNTVSKAWDETLALCLSGLARVLRPQLASAARAPGFEARFSVLLDCAAEAGARPSKDTKAAALGCLAALASETALAGPLLLATLRRMLPAARPELLRALTAVLETRTPTCPPAAAELAADVLLTALQTETGDVMTLAAAGLAEQGDGETRAAATAALAAMLPRPRTLKGLVSSLWA